MLVNCLLVYVQVLLLRNETPSPDGGKKTMKNYYHNNSSTKLTAVNALKLVKWAS